MLRLLLVGTAVCWDCCSLVSLWSVDHGLQLHARITLGVAVLQCTCLIAYFFACFFSSFVSSLVSSLVQKRMARSSEASSRHPCRHRTASESAGGQNQSRHWGVRARRGCLPRRVSCVGILAILRGARGGTAVDRRMRSECHRNNDPPDIEIDFFFHW